MTQLATATANASGAATFSFQGPPTGFSWAATVSVPGVPGRATGKIVVAGFPVAPIYGGGPVGPIPVPSRQVLTIAMNGLTVGQSYLAILAYSVFRGTAPPSTIQPSALSAPMPSTSPYTYGGRQTGNVTISGTVTLTKPMYAARLVVPAGAVLVTHGYPVFAATGATVTGTITARGKDGATGGTGAPGGLYHGGGAGGEETGSGTPTPGTSPTAATYEGGAGGAGYTGGTIHGATGGTTTPGYTYPPTFTEVRSGTLSGGGGGGGCTQKHSTTVVAARGGGGGGVIVLAARTLAGGGTITAQGGNGQANATLSLNIHAAAGGAGGGLVLVFCTTSSFQGTATAAGGTGATISGGPTVGKKAADGSAGLVQVLQAQ